MSIAVAVDRSGLIDDVLAQPQHLMAAAGCTRGTLEPIGSAPGMVVCGMGGSAIGADLCRAVLGPRAAGPVFVHRDYADAALLGGPAVVVCASYSGNTEETLSCYAGAAGTRRLVVTTGGRLGEMAGSDGVPVLEVPGGLQPRAAVAHMLMAMLECARACGVASLPPGEVEGAAGLLDVLGREWGPDGPGDSPAKALAGRLAGAIPVIHGAGETAPIARRWKGQVNENAEAPAFASEIPEANHNELCSWPLAPGPAAFTGVFLESPGHGAAHARRMSLTADAVEAAGVRVERVRAIGETPLERVLSLVFLGDLMSVYLAVAAGVDPTPVEPIERFKAALAG